MENTDTGNNYTVENGELTQNGDKTLIEGKESGGRSNFRLTYQRDGSRTINFNLDDGYVELTEANDAIVVTYASEENGFEGGIALAYEDGGYRMPEDGELSEGMEALSGKATDTGALGYDGDSVDRVDAVLDDEVPSL
jgi:hypothetical protein